MDEIRGLVSIVAGTLAVVGVGIGAKWAFNESPSASPTTSSPPQVHVTVINQVPEPKETKPAPVAAYRPVNLPLSTPKAPQLSEWAKTARDYSYEGVRLGMTLEEFRRIRPGATVHSHDRNTFVWTDSARAASLAYYTFVSDKCRAIKVVYFNDDITRIGGRSAVEAKTRQLFGNPHRSDGLSSWDFPEVNRHVIFNYRPTKNKTDSADLEVMDTKSGASGLGVGD